MNKELLELQEALEKEKERFRRYEATVVSEFDLLRKFSDKYNFDFHSLEGFLQKIENLFDTNESARHSIDTIREYSEKLKNVTDFLERERQIVFEDFELMQKLKVLKTEKESVIKDYYNLRNASN